MIGNDRLFMAVLALATVEGDVRKRVCIAMRNIEVIREDEFKAKPELWKRIEALKVSTKSNGAQVINQRVILDAYENTAKARQNKTYSRYAKEIFEIWMETCKES